MSFIIFLPVLLLLLITSCVISYSGVKLIIHGGTRVEITFTLVKLELYDFGKSKGDKKTSFVFYRKLYSRLSSLFKVSTVKIKQLTVPYLPIEDYAPTSFTTPYRFHIAISAFIAYLNKNSQKLTIDDNAVILSPDENAEFSLILTARTRLYHIIRTVLGIIADKKQTEK
jgi:hypothetical protein